MTTFTIGESISQSITCDMFEVESPNVYKVRNCTAGARKIPGEFSGIDCEPCWKSISQPDPRDENKKAIRVAPVLAIFKCVDKCGAGSCRISCTPITL